MTPSPLLQDLGRALDLLAQVDESQLEFEPDPTVSDDVHQLTGLDRYPVESHRANLQSRIDAVLAAGERLGQRAPSEYVSKPITACVRLSPPSDD